MLRTHCGRVHRGVYGRNGMQSLLLLCLAIGWFFVIRCSCLAQYQREYIYVDNKLTAVETDVIINDTTAPQIEITSPPATPYYLTNSNVIHLQCTASDDVKIKGVTISGNGTCSKLSSSGVQESWACSVELPIHQDNDYALTATAQDTAGNRSTANIMIKYDSTAPAITGVYTSGIGSRVATIGWTTSEPSDTQIEYGTTAAYGSRTVLNGTAATSHSQRLEGLTEGTEYHFRVKSQDPATNASYSGDYSFRTVQCSYSISPANAGMPAVGGDGSFNISCALDCSWTAVSDNTWIKINGSASGVGSGKVNFTVNPNIGPARTGTIRVGGQTFTIGQSPGCIYTLSSVSTSIGSGAGAGSFNIACASGCGWTAVSNNSWIKISGQSSGTGNGTINFTVDPNTGPARTGTIAIGAQTFTINQLSGCTYSVYPASISVTAGGEPGSVGIACASGCAWTAASNDSWIQLTNQSSGTGASTVSFFVGFNTGPARTGTIKIGGQTFTINQLSGCAYSISPTDVTAAATGGPGGFGISSPPGCAWTAVSSKPWITFMGESSGNGSKNINYFVESNSGAVRTGTITVAGRTFTINQLSNCTYSLSPTSASIPAVGGRGTVNIVCPYNCSWTATTGNAWIRFAGSTSGSGNGTLNYLVDINPGLARTGSITVGNQTFTVNQLSNCTYAISPTTARVSAGGGIGSFSVACASNCSWNTSSNNYWIAVLRGSSGNGNGAVLFSVESNTGPARTGTISVKGQTFTVNQMAPLKVAFRTGNGSYFSAENGGGGALRADRTWVYSWETFTMNPLGGVDVVNGSVITLQTDNGHYVTAVNGGGGAVTAAAISASSAERFTVIRVSGAGVIQNGDAVYLKASNGMYVVAENEGGGDINANRTMPGPWETFTIQFK